jgi:hypothetical protein
LYNGTMKRYAIEDTVEFRSGDRHLYGVIMSAEKDEEDQLVFQIFAGNLIYRNIREEDILKNFGSEQ